MIYRFNINDKVYEELLNIIEDKSIKHNSELVGNIREEYSLEKHIEKLEPYILKKLSNIKKLKDYIEKLRIFYPHNLPLKIDTLWVNYQKQYEFNPLHHHSGILSFILFIKIPYTFDQEQLASPGIESNYNNSGMLSFLYLNSDEDGGISKEIVPADKSWEQTGLIFKSNLNHCVYPFFSKGVRITISGNMSFYNAKKK